MDIQLTFRAGDKTDKGIEGTLSEFCKDLSLSDQLSPDMITSRDNAPLTAETILAALPSDVDLSACRVGRWADDLAIVFARKAVEVEPYSMQYRCHLASLLRKRGDFEGAEESIHEGLEINENWSDGYIQLAAGKEAQGKFDQAIVLARKAVVTSPYLMQHREYLCHLLHRIRNFDEALLQVTEGLKINPYWGIGHRRRSQIYDAMGDLDCAIESARKAVETEHYTLGFRAHLSSLLRKKYALQEAGEVVHVAQQMNPYWREGHRHLSMGFDLDRNMQNAIDEAQKAVEGDPYDLGFKAYLANLLRRDGKIEEAVNTARQGVDINPKWGEGYRQMSLAHSARGEYDPALEEARMATRVEPYSLPLKAHLCNLLRENGEWDEAATTARDGLGINPAWSEGYRQLAYVMDATGRGPCGALSPSEKLDAAIEHAQEAVLVDPYTLGHRSYLCDLMRRKSQDEALKLALEGLELHPRWADGHRQVSLVYDARKKTDDAIMHARKAVKAEPYNLGIRSHLCNLLRKTGKLDEVITVAHEGLLINPKWCDAHMQIAAVHDLRKQPRASIRAVRHAWRLDPEAGRCGDRLADMYRALGELDKVITVVNTALTRNVWQSWAHKQLALVHQAHGEIPQAVYEARLACTLAPRDRACVELLANLFMSNDNIQSVRKLVKDSAKLLPTAVWLNELNQRIASWFKEQHSESLALVDTAFLLLQTENHEGALAKLDESLAISPELAEAYEVRAQIHAASNEIEQALGCARKACELSANEPFFLNRLAEIYRQSGNIDELATLAQDMLQRNPQSALGHKQASHVFLLRQDEEKALHSARIAVDLAPGDQGCVEHLVHRLLETKNYDEAEEAINVVLETKSDSTWAYMLKVAVYEAQGQFAIALGWARKAMQKSPFALVRNRYKSLISHCCSMEAKEAREKLEREPYERAATEQLCLALRREGELAEAQRIVQAVLSHNSQAGWAHRLQSLLYCSVPDMDAAVVAGITAMQCLPNDKECVEHLINLFRALKRFDEAEAIALEATRNFPDAQWPATQLERTRNVRKTHAEVYTQYLLLEGIPVTPDDAAQVLAGEALIAHPELHILLGTKTTEFSEVMP